MPQHAYRRVPKKSCIGKAATQQGQSPWQPIPADRKCAPLSMRRDSESSRKSRRAIEMHTIEPVLHPDEQHVCRLVASRPCMASPFFDTRPFQSVSPDCQAHDVGPRCARSAHAHCQFYG
jgi:hypothetical protein